MYIMTKRRRIRQKRKTRKLFKFIKRRRGRMKKRAKKFRRTFRKRHKQLNLRFKSLRRGGVKTPTKRSVHAAAAAKKTAAKLQKKAKAATSHANKENAQANKKRKEANAATTKAASAKAAATTKAAKDPTSASARKAAFRAKQAKKKAQQKQNVASKATAKATKATAKATKATAKATKATAKATKATAKATKATAKATKATAKATTAKAHRQSTKQTKKAPRMKPKAQAPVSFKAGDKVIVQGLKGRSDLNGKQGTIKSKSKKPGLYTVDLNVKTGAKPPGTGCKTASDCKSYHCKNSICAPGSTQIDIKPTNIKLVSAPRKAHSAPKHKDLCKPFTITSTPCSALKSQFQKDVRLCHPDQNKGPNAVLDFQTLHTNYAAQKQWCDKGGKGGRPAPQGKDEWNCAQNPKAKWNKATKKCVVEKKSHTKGNQPCKTDKECHSGSCVSKKCLPQISVGKPCKKSKNCLSANCYVDTDGKAISLCVRFFFDYAFLCRLIPFCLGVLCAIPFIFSLRGRAPTFSTFITPLFLCCIIGVKCLEI